MSQFLSPKYDLPKLQSPQIGWMDWQTRESLFRGLRPSFKIFCWQASKKTSRLLSTNRFVIIDLNSSGKCFAHNMPAPHSKWIGYRSRFSQHSSGLYHSTVRWIALWNSATYSEIGSFVSDVCRQDLRPGRIIELRIKLNNLVPTAKLSKHGLDFIQTPENIILTQRGRQKKQRLGIISMLASCFIRILCPYDRHIL